MVKRMAIYALLRLSFTLSQAQYLYRRMTGGLCSDDDLTAFLAANGVHAEAIPAMFAGLREKFQYRPDGAVDFPKHPLVFLHDRTDDCDGYALFYEAVFKRFNIPCSRVYVKAHNDRGHTVCVAMVYGIRYAFSNWDVVMLSSDSLSDIGAIISKRMDSSLAYAVRCDGFRIREYYHS